VEAPAGSGESPKNPGENPTVAEDVWVSASFTSLLLKEDAFGDLGSGSVAVLGNHLPIAREDTLGVPVKAGKETLILDRDGDGKYDTTVPRKGGVVAIKTSYEGGVSGLYYAWFTCSNGVWSYRSYNCMAGRISGARVYLFDENGNGRFDDPGIDRIAFGSAEVYSYVNPMALLGEDLVRMRVSPSGTRVEVQPYSGETGTVDVHSGFHGCGRPQSAIISDGQICFNVAALGRPVRVPAGTYRIIEGTVAGQRSEVSFVGSADSHIQVSAGQASVVEWGGPLTIEFQYENGGNRIAFRTEQVRFVGLFGEHYYRAPGQPVSRTRVVVRDALNQRVLKEIVAGTAMSLPWNRNLQPGVPAGSG
jgi:hypothetical protein